MLAALGKESLCRELQNLSEYNQIGARYGLMLSESQLSRLIEGRYAALSETDRVEFGSGVLKELIYSFCDSPYIDQSNYEDTLMTLQELFYTFKNECRDRLSDDELIRNMKIAFDHRLHGSLEALAQTPVEALAEAPEEDLYDDWTE